MKKIYLFILAAAISVSSCDSPLDETKDNEEIPVEPQKEYYYQKVTAPLDDWSGEYLITYTSTDEIKVLADWEPYGQPAKDQSGEINFNDFLTENGIYAEKADPYKSTITRNAGGYSINVASLWYIGYSGSKNSLSKEENPDTGDNSFLWEIKYSNNTISISPANASDRRLQWNESAPRFACYTGSQKEITLYRRTAAGSTENPGEPDTDPEPPVDPEDPDQPTVPDTNIKGWFELPVITDKDGDGINDNNRDIYYASHICAGGEKDSKGRPARNYTVCFSAEHHVPLWVAAPRHRMYTSSAKRTDAYNADPEIPASIQYNSKSTGDGCNKGHMLGSAERTSSSATNRQVFYYTNIAPQKSSTFNTGGGAWNNLEDYVDGLVPADTLYEVIGCHFETYTDAYGNRESARKISFGGRSDVSLPTMFYYVLLRTKSGNTGKAVTECKPEELQCAAFVMCHAMQKGHKPQAKDMMSVAELEKITGFTYFANVPNAPKDSYKPSDWGL
ncbi:MAG: DNA/RNA non-specific endonuclease [Bacteroidales bacterium]|mgnify:CR=1 FL=1|nr:DNA/RNA non-specific endonuclease [Bacteroidales bacterium]